MATGQPTTSMYDGRIATLVITLCAAAGLFLASCSNAADTGGTQSDGLILYGEFTRCAGFCCGAWYIIEIDGQTYRFNSVPAGSSVDPSSFAQDDYPVPVRLDWNVSSETCARQQPIDVLHIERR